MPSGLECKILGCAMSDLEPDAFPFAVVLMRQIGGKATLTGYVLLHWEFFFQRYPDGTYDTIQQFIGDFALYEPGDETERFFRHLGTLGVGVIRVLRARSLEHSEVNEEIAQLLAGLPGSVVWPNSFTVI